MISILKPNLLIPLLYFFVAFFFVPLQQLEMLSLMPGLLGDARLNNYFLENVYQFIVGGSNSLWHLPFFAPYPYTIGFSDNLFGTSLIYVFFRLLNLEADTAYQGWFILGYFANFGAAYYALRRLNGSVLAATVGALIFTFALPTSAHAWHAQLHYRFGLPLAIVFFLNFLNDKVWRYFLISFSWVVWQFYAGIYMGFFTSLLLITMSLTYLGYMLISGQGLIKDIFNNLTWSWCSQTKTQKIIFFGGIALLFVLIILLFYPYFQVTQLYGAKRSWSDIAIMLPRPQSYFLSDTSFWWAFRDAEIFSGMPMRHEHQMFIGLFPLLLAFAGFIIGCKSKKKNTSFILMTGMLTISVVITLYIGGFSIWYLVHHLPLASAIRAMTRIDQALLFPIAYLAVITIDKFKLKYAWATVAVFVLILPLLIAEFSMTSMGTSSKLSWRDRLLAIEKIMPENLTENKILFFAQRTKAPYDDLDAMWASLRHGKKTMNGYSGNFPPDYDYEFGRDCSQIPRRVLSYLKFSQQQDNAVKYRELMSQIIPIGFDGCDINLFRNPPIVTSVDFTYLPEEFKKLSYGKNEIIKNGDQLFAHVTIVNSSNKHFSANSAIGNPIRISWRYLDAKGNPLSGWDARKNLPFDIPGGGKLQVSIPLELSTLNNAGAVQVSLVQELVFWGHDIGLEPLTISLK